MSRSTTDKKELGRLLQELSQSLAEEDISALEGTRRRGAMRQQLKSIGKLLGATETQGNANVIHPTAADPEPTAAQAQPLKVSQEWLTVANAGRIAGVHRGTVARLANAGRIIDNGQKRHKRRVLKSSVLQWMCESLEKQRKRGYADYCRKLDYIPERH
jgi:hypothetical protein